MSNHPVQIRGATNNDAGFIFDTWLNSFRRSHHTRGIEGPVYYDEQRRIIETLLPRCSVLMACDSKYPTSLFGYAVAEIIDNLLVLHWVYMREALRDHGIGTQLVKTYLDAEPGLAAIIYTHQTKAGRKWDEKMRERAPMTEHNGRMPVIYNPYLMYRTLGAAWRS